MTAINLRKRYEALEPRYNWLWKGAKCYYCGDPSDTTDHVPAISIAYSLGAERLNRRGFNLWKVSCCKECNFCLADRFILSPEKRGRWLYDFYLKTRYRRFILNGGIKFTQDELDEFGPNLRSFLQNHKNVRDWLEHRFSYMENIFGIEARSEDIWETQV